VALKSWPVREPCRKIANRKVRLPDERTVYIEAASLANWRNCNANWRNCKANCKRNHPGVRISGSAGSTAVLVLPIRFGLEPDHKMQRQAAKKPMHVG